LRCRMWIFNHDLPGMTAKNPPFLGTAEEHGITVVEVSEAHTSDTCPRCRSRNSERRGRLFRCLGCGLEAHRDAVGVANMASLSREKAVRVVAHPALLRWDGCRWKGKSSMPTKEDEHQRSANLPTQSRRESGLEPLEDQVLNFARLLIGDRDDEPLSHGGGEASCSDQFGGCQRVCAWAD